MKKFWAKRGHEDIVLVHYQLSDIPTFFLPGTYLYEGSFCSAMIHDSRPNKWTRLNSSMLEDVKPITRANRLNKLKIFYHFQINMKKRLHYKKTGTFPAENSERISSEAFFVRALKWVVNCGVITKWSKRWPKWPIKNLLLSAFLWKLSNTKHHTLLAV